MNSKEAGALGYEKAKEILKLQHQRRLDDYHASPKKCKVCDDVIPYKKRLNDYCSRSCAASYNNHRRQGKVAEPCPHIASHPCSVCGCMISQRRKRKYCSHDCRVEANWLTYKLQILKENKLVLPDDSSGRRTAKKFLSEARGRRCEICGLDQWLGKPIPLVLDHIDGNSDNWLLTNLRLVCGNCNMQLPTFAGRNRGKGRTARRKLRR